MGAKFNYFPQVFISSEITGFSACAFPVYDTVIDKNE